MLRLADMPLRGKRVLVRADFNVPMDDDGQIRSDARIRATMPTLQQIMEQGAQLRLMSHLGRPREGAFEQRFSLAPVARRLGQLLGCAVRLQDGLDEPGGDGGPVLFENVRFNPGESADDRRLGARYAALCDVFVMDAFGSAHRANASTSAVARQAPAACAGLLLTAELDALERAMRDPARPLLAILGGAKVSGKLGLLEHLATRVDSLIVGGGIANTFLAAAGHEVGRSLCEPDMVAVARRIMQGCAVPLPEDLWVGASPDAPARLVAVDGVAADDMILDVGSKTQQSYAAIISEAETIIWNGPLGVFEKPAYASGTRSLAQAVAAASGFCLCGGGDTLAAIEQFGVGDLVGHKSTGGGAFLECLEGRTLPAVAALDEREAAMRKEGLL